MAEDHATIEAWLAQTGLGGMVISTEQYDDEILTVLADVQPLEKVRQQLQQHPAISTCEEKLRAVFRVTMTTAPGHVLCSFPFRGGEEWYVGAGKTAYLCTQSHQLNDQQISWLAANAQIADGSTGSTSLSHRQSVTSNTGSRTEMAKNHSTTPD